MSLLGGFVIAALLLEKVPSAGAGGGQGAGVACAAQNGDVNADGRVDLTDAVTILGNLFLGNPTELPPLCATPPPSGLAATGQTACWRFDEGLFVETSCGETECAGHDDWRLPNIRELQSIVDYGRMEPAIDPAFGGLAQYYWSSTSYAQSPNDGWGIGFNVGYIGVRPKFGDFDFSFNFVRAVRGGMR